MTVLPTVRRQLQEAAERQAGRAAGRTRARLYPEPFAGAIGVVFGTAAVAVALGFAAVLLVLLGHHARGHPSAPARGALLRPCSPSSVPTCKGGAYPTLAHRAPRRLLSGNGIGAIRFGQTARRVDVELTRLLGRPEAEHVVSICGFDHYSVWVGLDIRPSGVTGGHRYFRAQLTIFFKHSRFVGYEYNDDQYIARDAPWSETSYPLASPQARQVLYGPRLTLATAKGLVLGETVGRARHMYGRAFAQTTREQGTPPNPRLTRLPTWNANTPSGLISGGIYNATQLGSFYASSQPGIASIRAGDIPNTPCH